MGEWRRKTGTLAAGVVFLATLTAAGCGSSEQGNAGGSGSSGLREENAQLREENANLEEEIGRLEEEAEGLRSDIAEARAEAEEAESAAGQAAEDESGGTLTAVGPEELEGEPLPGLVPDDLPLPSGGSVRDVYEDDYTFSMTILLPSTFDETLAFYEERLPEVDWQEVVGDRVEGTTNGFRGVETSWDKGTYIPQDLPQDDPDYEQVAQNMDISVYELDPSGVQVDVRWYDYELSDSQREAEENDADGQSS